MEGTVHSISTLYPYKEVDNRKQGALHISIAKEMYHMQEMPFLHPMEGE